MDEMPSGGFPGASSDAAAVFIEGIGKEISDTWAQVSSLAGRLFAALYLAGRPMDMDELAQLVGRSKSNVLVNLRALVALGLASRAWVPGSRRDMYAVGDDYGNIILRAFLRRLGANLENNGRAVQDAARMLDELDPDAADREHIALMKARVATTAQFYRSMQALYAKLADTTGFEVDFTALFRDVSGPIGRNNDER